jgi:hypothetical protein
MSEQMSQDQQVVEMDLGITFDDGQEVEGQLANENESKGQGNDANSDATKDSEGQHEENADSAKSNIDQEAVNRRIAQKHREAKEASERAERAERELAELKGQQQQVQLEEPKIPDFPDRYSLSDQEFEEALAVRDEALRKHASWRYEQQQIVQRQTALQQEQTNNFVNTVNEQVVKYTERATQNGIDAAQLKKIGENIGAYGLDGRVVLEILADEDGPLIAKYLSEYPSDLEKVSKMDAVQAVSFIERHVRNKAIQLKPKTTNAPAPATRVEGGKSDTDLAKYPLTAGVQYD